MAKLTAKTSLADLAGIVSEKLRSKGISTILVGGGVVSIYTDNRYESGDLDFVVEQFLVRKGVVDSAMAELGFQRDKSRVYLHPECRYAIDFSPPPAAIGNQIVKDPAEFKAKTGIVRLLTPTQSVMDRLAAYYHFDDLQGLNQAVLIVSGHRVDLKKVAAWSESEGHVERHAVFLQRLKNLKKTGKR